MKIVFILLEVFLFFSCNHRQSTELLKIKPIDELLTEIPVSEFADSVSLIQLDNRFLLQAMGIPVLLIVFSGYSSRWCLEVFIYRRVAYEDRRNRAGTNGI